MLVELSHIQGVKKPIENVHPDPLAGGPKLKEVSDIRALFYLFHFLKYSLMSHSLIVKM